MKKYFSPGRVNLIGEHLDYNGGLVLPAAIQLGITVTLTPRHDNKINFLSANHSFALMHDLDDAIEYTKYNDWTNYPLGIIKQLLAEGHAIIPCDLYFESTLPEGSGLSSSAALEVLTGYALLSQTESQINRVWLSNLCQQVENEFIGVKCGIMDQMSVALGKKDHALLLDCASLKHENIPFELGTYRLLIMNSKKPRSLITSKYNERKTECDEALRIIQATQPDVKHLAQAPPHLLSLISDETIHKRAKHVISENYRVKEAVKVLMMNDLSTFGRLMNASHTSLRDDYAVSGIELDTLVEAAQQATGCLGARMTGAGFGGCAIAIVQEQRVAEFTQIVSEQYLKTTGLNCEIYSSTFEDGVHEIKG